MTLRSLTGLTLMAVVTATTACAPPATRRAAVTDTYHGVSVTEHYRWLEDGNDPAVREWTAAQNAYARRILDQLPHVEAIRARVTEILSAETVSYGTITYRGGRLFAIKRQPPKQQPFLVVMPSADEPDQARVLVDPNVMDPEGTTAIDWYKPSWDGKLVAVSLSEGGTETGDVHIYDTVTGREVHEVIPRVNSGTAGGSLAWAPGGSGFFYTRHPRGNERPPEDMNFYQQVYFHALGTPTEQDRYEIGKDFPRIAEIQLDMDRKTGRLIATVQNGDGGEFAHFLRSPDGQWRQFSRFGDRTLQAVFGPNDDLYVLTRRDAPRGRLMHLPIADLDVAKATMVIGQGDDTLVSAFWGPSTIVATDTRLYVVYQLGGPSEIRVFGLDGKPLAAPKQLPISAVGGLTRLNGDDLMFRNASFIDSPAWYRFVPASGATEKTALATDSPVDFDDVEVVREFAVSQDGTRVPVNIIMPKGTQRDGTHPCIVYGYGGYGVSIEPRYRAARRVLLDQGILYAVANLRGGGEYGEQWHLQGNLTHKQNVFDDFAAVIRHMVSRRYTQPSRLAILGGSNGGLLMGATMTQHPALMKAVVSYVGIYDMLRVERSPNGAFNIPEFGTVKNPAQFIALYTYSPYHNVKDGTPYPATLFLTGENDPRVDPMQSRKMTARLQAATSASAPILLRTSANVGHGGDTALAERIEQTVDVYAFLFDQLGVPFRSGRAKAQTQGAASSLNEAAPRVAFEQDRGKLQITVGGAPLATYVYEDEQIPRPYFAHVHAPGGVQVTRNHPPRKGDAQDHATFHPGICTETCRYTILVRPAGYLLICDSMFTSDAGDFYFGDQEELGLGVRPATPIAVNQNKGGRILDSEGRINEAGVWGKQADWCDYSGTIDGQSVGITIMPDPGNVRKCWWHARDYGFLAANPYGVNAFTNGPKSRIVVKRGTAHRLRYGVLLHGGKNMQAADLKAAYADFLQQIKR